MDFTCFCQLRLPHLVPYMQGRESESDDEHTTFTGKRTGQSVVALWLLVH